MVSMSEIGYWIPGILIIVKERTHMKSNYLNNKDILKEIHKSKSTYCAFLQPVDADYDMILQDISGITPQIILEARQLRSERLSKLAHEAAVLAAGEKRRLDDFVIDVATIVDTDVVFRVMTWDHIPIDEVKSAKARAKLDLEDEEDDIVRTEYDEDVLATTKYTKCNFPPFQHHRVDSQGQPECIGKSHWKGNLITGEFSRDHGAMTKKLALMFMKLCERYATRSNWRGYTYNDEMRSQALLQLSQIGLQFDESKSQNPFAYYTAAITNSFTRVLNIEKRNQNLRDDILEMNGMNPSYSRQMMSGGGSSVDE